MFFGIKHGDGPFVLTLGAHALLRYGQAPSLLPSAKPSTAEGNKSRYASTWTPRVKIKKNKEGKTQLDGSLVCPCVKHV